MGPNVEEGDAFSLGNVDCTASGDDLLIVMENDLTTTGFWRDEKMIWTLSLQNPTDKIECYPTIDTKMI